MSESLDRQKEITKPGPDFMGPKIIDCEGPLK